MTDKDELTVEAVLFAMGASVETRQLAAALGCEPAQAREAARRLQRRYDDEERAIRVIELEDCFQMCTRNEYYDALVRVVKTPRKQVLTEAVMETLSIIAYRQPVTRTEIEKIRGVSSAYAVNKLIEYGLVYEAGRLDVPGRPATFATTEEFLRRFGVASRKDLPSLDADMEAQIIRDVTKEVGYRPEDEISEGEAQESALGDEHEVQGIISDDVGGTREITSDDEDKAQESAAGIADGVSAADTGKKTQVIREIQI